MEYTFNSIKEKGLLLYEYIRGSKAYGLDLPTSDEDRGAIYIMDKQDYLKFPSQWVQQVSDEKHDTIWYELNRFMELLCDSNPNVLEALFVKPEHILFMHPLFKLIYDNREMFITKSTFNTFIGYAASQIKKARGLNKMIVNPIVDRKQPIDFCYTFNNYQGTEPISSWLEKRGLKQIYCGLNHMSNMNQMYGVFYDWPQHIKMEYSYEEFRKELKSGWRSFFWSFIKEDYENYCLRIGKWNIEGYYNQLTPKGYHGIVKEDGSSCDVHLDSILKGDKPICFLSYNKDGFSSHCTLFKNFKKWEKERNPQRFLENQGKEFDRKNMMHCARLLTMGIEIAQTGKVNIDRSKIDRDFLLNIRLGNTTYDELISFMDSKLEELKKLSQESILPEKVDLGKAMYLLSKLKSNFYNYD